MNTDNMNYFSDEDFFAELTVLEKESHPLSEEERLLAMKAPLLHWYHKHKRSLPWREDPTPYHVWISEIMLQQTRVEAVKGYYARFLEGLPTIEALAACEEERLLKYWEGLGYYSRVRNMKKAAMQVVEEHGGALPMEKAALLKLPGIGSYTAGAVSSIAYGQKVPAVDGNVLRVISRLLASREDILKQKTKTSMEELLERTMSEEEPGAYNQALMEIGAMVCVPNGAPHCGECPLSGLCLARKEELISEIPVKTPKKGRKIEEKTILVITDGENILIRKRPDQGLLAGLYEFPWLEGHVDEKEALTAAGLSKEKVTEIKELGAAKHIFSHIEWHMKGYLIHISGFSGKTFDGEIVPIQKAEESYAFPNALKAYYKPVFVGNSARKREVTNR